MRTRTSRLARGSLGTAHHGAVAVRGAPLAFPLLQASVAVIIIVLVVVIDKEKERGRGCTHRTNPELGLTQARLRLTRSRAAS